MRSEYELRYSEALCKNLLIRVMNKLTNHHFISCLYLEDTHADIENVLDCEAHHELAL